MPCDHLGTIAGMAGKEDILKLCCLPLFVGRLTGGRWWKTLYWRAFRVALTHNLLLPLGRRQTRWAVEPLLPHRTLATLCHFSRWLRWRSNFSRELSSRWRYFRRCGQSDRDVTWLQDISGRQQTKALPPVSVGYQRSSATPANDANAYERRRRGINWAALSPAAAYLRPAA